MKSSWYGTVVLEECKRLRKSILPISNENYGPLDKIFRHNTLYPFVLLLGNHSSGKSSFINYLLNRKIQATGVAPTDDNFTIIAPGEEDFDRNGPAFIGDPDLGFNDLKVFGPVLVNHTQLKVRSSIAIEDFMIVDSPGMIDSPANSRQLTANDPTLAKMDRGYDFETVCRWYAERADVILLFFDPDKPGTTGETLSILTNSLVGFDHKLFIVLNKADQFCRIHDFARAYGSLCWNLSKVISRKDLPRIYTMCLPSEYITETEKTVSSLTAASNTSLDTPEAPLSRSESKTGLGSTNDELNQQTPPPVTPLLQRQSSFYKQGILDLEESRNEVLKEVFNAPRRRVDNEISRLFESTHALLMHCKLLDIIVRDYNFRLWKYRLRSGLMIAASFGLTIAAGYFCDWILSTSSSETNTSAAATSTKAPKVKPIATPIPIKSAPTVATTGSTTLVEAATAPSFGQVIGQSISTFLSKLSYKQITVSATASISAVVTGGLYWWQQLQLTKYLASYDTRTPYENLFNRLYAKEIQDHDQFHLSLGKIAIDQMMTNLNSTMIGHLSYVKKGAIKALEKIIEDDIAELRRRASPTFPQIESQIINKKSENSTVTSAVISHLTANDQYYPVAGDSSFIVDSSRQVTASPATKPLFGKEKIGSSAEPILLKPSDITGTHSEEKEVKEKVEKAKESEEEVDEKKEEVEDDASIGEKSL